MRSALPPAGLPDHRPLQQGRIETMWEKLRVVWQIPELRQKILLTLLMLAVYRVGFQIQLPVINQAEVSKFSNQTGGLSDMLQAVAVLSASATRPGDDLRPGHHAVHLGVDHLPVARQRLSAARTAAEGRRGGPQENQRVHALRDRALLLVPELVLRRVVHRAAGLRAAGVSRMRPAKCRSVGRSSRC